MAAPNGPSQVEVIKIAGKGTGLSRCATEAHGTGTLLGDAIEIGALMTVFGAEDHQVFGAKSSRFGHTEAAAGPSNGRLAVFCMTSGLQILDLGCESPIRSVWGW